MSRLARANPAAPAIAALHERQGTLALVILRARAPLSVLSAHTFTRDQAAEIVAALASAGVTRLVRVAPPRRTICRAAPLPAGTPEELDAASAILAEASLPEEIPAHRRSSGVLPGSGPAGASALLTAWRPGDEGIAEIPWPDQRWTTEIAALAFLSACRGVSVSAHPESGAISIVAPGVGRLAARVLVESADSKGAWESARDRHLAETCAAVGVEVPSVPRGRTLIIADGALTALRAAIENVPSDGAWLETYGLALGALLVASSAEPGAARLAEMLPEPPSRRVPMPERAAAWLSVPRHAGATVVIALVVLLLAPLAMAGARSAILSRKAAALPSDDKSRAELDRRTALYAQLEQVRWPMTKLLADISAATPVGVTVDSVRLAPDQGLALQGSAESPDLLNDLQKNLNSTGLFEKLKVARSEVTDKGVSFDLSADILKPHTPVKPVDDFAKHPLIKRLYGEDAVASTSSAGENGSRRNGRDGEPRRENGRENRRDRAADSTPGRPAARSVDIPPELTDTQIAALDRTKAMLEWSKRKGVVNSPQVDAPTKGRLENEISKLKDRMDKLKSGGGT